MKEYKKLQIIKHALQHYVKRPNATTDDIRAEKRVLENIEWQVSSLQDEYGIEPAVKEDV